MILSMYFLSILLFILGWIYYSRPEQIQKINNFFKANVFNDRYILIKRKKIGVLFFLLAFFFSTSAFVYSIEEKALAKNTASNNLIVREILNDTAVMYTQTLKDDPDNIHLIMKLALTFDALGDYKKASLAWAKILLVDPHNDIARKRAHDKY